MYTPYQPFPPPAFSCVPANPWGAGVLRAHSRRGDPEAGGGPVGRGYGAHGGVGVPVVLHAGQAREGDASVPAEGPEADLGESPTARSSTLEGGPTCDLFFCRHGWYIFRLCQ